MSAAAKQATRGRGSHHEVPWVTFALLAICIVMYSVTMVVSRQVQASAEEKLQAAVGYLLEHAYLEPGPILAERVAPGLLEQRRAVERQARDRRGALPILQAVQKKQKQQLDQLVADAFADEARLPTRRFGLSATEFSPPALVSHVFLHESGLHLACAVFLFLALGFQLEGRWGGGVFAGFFVLASVASGACFTLANSGFPAPLIGMSGAVAGLLAAYAIGFRSIWHHPVYLFLLIGGGLFLALPPRVGHDWSLAAGLEARAVLSVHQGVSYWAAAGGLVFGVLGQLGISLFRGPSASKREGSGGKSSQVASPELERVLDARAAGRLNEAYGLLGEVLRKAPENHEALLVMWDVALDHDRPSEAAAAMLRAIRDEVKRNDASAAVEHWLELTDRGLHADAEPALLIRLAQVLHTHEQNPAAVAALRLALRKSGDADAAVVATRVARVARDFDAETAREAAWRALGSVGLELEERQSLEAMLAEIGSVLADGGAAESDSSLAVDFDPAVEGASVARRPPAAPPAVSEAWVDPSLADDAPAPPAAPRPLELEDLVSVGGGLGDERDDRASFRRPEAIALDVSAREIRILAARPLALHPDGLRIEAEQGAKKRLPLAKLEAIAVAAVAGLSQKPVLLIDLVMNWTSGADEPLKVVRFRGDQFDARKLAGESDSPLDALRAFVAVLIAESGAAALPDEQSAKGMPFAAFDDLDAYQSSVLGVEADASD
jgi:membrane associated rhomboid family serine protease